MLSACYVIEQIVLPDNRLQLGLVCRLSFIHSVLTRWRTSLFSTMRRELNLNPYYWLYTSLGGVYLMMQIAFDFTNILQMRLRHNNNNEI